MIRSRSVGSALSALSALSISVAAFTASALPAAAVPTIYRLTPPSRLFTYGKANGPIVARFLPDQRFDLQATIVPDTGKTITSVQFAVDGKFVSAAQSGPFVPTDLPSAPTGGVAASVRAFSTGAAGVHLLSVTAKQSDGQTVTRQSSFEILAVKGERGGKKIKNVIICIGDGMGAAHRTAARVMLSGVEMGRSVSPLNMDTFPNMAMISTASLNSIVTDSSPGAHCYSTGNKADNNEEGVFPDDTKDPFDNPRIESIGEFLFRTEGKTLGIITTADVFDATPAAFGVHTSDRGAGTGICDQYFDEQGKAGLRVLMGGGRKWFLPNSGGSITPQPVSGSQRRSSNDYILPADLATAWNVPVGARDPERDLLADFQKAGWYYASTSKMTTGGNTALQSVPKDTDRLLGLFSFGNMNVAKDKIDGRRGSPQVVSDFGFPDQPMLDEMAEKAITVLSRNPKGFILMVEGASIDKQAHAMDSERWILDTIEFDRAVGVCQRFAEKNGDTLVIVTADHECSGAAVIGASTVTNAELRARATGQNQTGKPTEYLRDQVVGIYESAGFPKYTIATDGYPVTTDVDRKLLIGYGANADRYEDWLTNPLPGPDSPFGTVGALAAYPKINTTGADPLNRPLRDSAGGLLVTGQVGGGSAAHTATDIPLSAYGRGASLFGGVLDNTDVFFRVMNGVLGGVK
ncbi:MAG: alkaline phosphatase [Cytophagales bacterium]|nr:alkaline phosphatase [Armatimonadota bacterium]